MASHKKLSAAIVGATGYAGGELVRLLLSHPNVSLDRIFSNTYEGQSISASFAGARFSNLTFEKFSDEETCDDVDVVFLAQAHGHAMAIAGALLARGKKVVDISADFRLRDPAVFAQWYGMPHADTVSLQRAVYGLPEVHREKIRTATLVANPGCYPTASALALLPLVANELISLDAIVIDAKSGVSGAGRGSHSLDYHFPEMNEDMRAYGVGGKHRHTPEIEQTLSDVSGRSILLSFTPHLIPITRGILSTCSAALKNATPLTELHKHFTEYYKSHPFVVVLPEGSFPTTKGCCGTNLCQIGIAVDARVNRVIVVSAIDNLVKGAAGQAVQNMNLMFGLEETAGLTMAGLWP